MFIFKIFTYSEHTSFTFCAKTCHPVFLGAGSYKKCGDGVLIFNKSSGINAVAHP